jgi:cytoskeleton protein RodZ
MGDSELVEEEGVPMSAGQRLRQAREASGLTLEEIATSTRIPTRHLESLEAGDFSRLPAPTYTIGFAKNFAAAVGLDRAEIGDQLRTEMGGSRPAMTTPEVFEPADPARAMPIWLIGAAIAALLLFAVLYNWWSNRELQPADEEVAAENVAATAPPPAAVAPQGQGPVVITATEAAWVEIKDGGVLLKQGELAPGETFQVPASALAPTLTTAKPEALRIAVGTTVAPTIGEPAKKVTASLKAEDLLRQRPAVPAAEQPRAEPLVPPRRPAASAPAPATTEPAADAAEPATQNQQ